MWDYAGLYNTDYLSDQNASWVAVRITDGNVGRDQKSLRTAALSQYIFENVHRNQPHKNHLPIG